MVISTGKIPIRNQQKLRLEPGAFQVGRLRPTEIDFVLLDLNSASKAGAKSAEKIGYLRKYMARKYGASSRLGDDTFCHSGALLRTTTLEGTAMSMDLSIHTGLESGYDYRWLSNAAPEAAIQKYASKTRALCALAAKEWTDDANTQWVARNYLAIKFITSATLMLSSAEYSAERNIRIAAPYLNYYSILSCCRAFLMTIPDLDWKGKTSFEMTHQNIINTTANYLRRLDSNGHLKWGNKIKSAKVLRELFSYYLPAQGLNVLKHRTEFEVDAKELCGLLAELSQFNSECLVSALEKHGPAEVKETNHEDLSLTMSYLDGELRDSEDAYRVGKHFRTFAKPACLDWMATEGLVEDLFGAWTMESDVDDSYNPDEHWRFIFNFR